MECGYFTDQWHPYNTRLRRPSLESSRIFSENGWKCHPSWKSTLGSVLNKELEKIQAQEALDAIDAANESDGDFFSAIVDADERISDNGESALNAWVKDRLRFALYDEGNGIKRYVYDLRRPTLVPLSNALDQFMSCIDDTASRVNARFQLPLKPFTLDRSKSEKHRLPLLRVGHPFMEALEVSVRNDDRGRAFAMWRFIPSGREPILFFRLDFLIEADLVQRRR